MATDARKKANAKYDRAHTKSVMLKLNTQTDADVLMKLDEVGNRQGYIKSLIRKDLLGTGEVLSLDSIRILIQPVAKKYGLEKVYVFGSYARGEASGDSDIDLSIEGGNFKGIFGFLDLQKAMEKAVGRRVDIVERKAIAEDNTRSGSRFRDHVERDQVLIYGQYTVNNLPDEVKEEYSMVPWHQIYGMRNVIAHGHEKIQEERVWDTIKSDIPELKVSVVRILEEYGIDPML